MTTIAETASMTGPEIVSLSRKHTLYEWSAQSKVDSHSRRQRQGNLFLHARGQALYRLQQPAHVRQHRTRRPARHSGHQRSSRHSRLCQSFHGNRAARAPLAPSSPKSVPAISILSSSPTAEPKPTRTPSSSLASLPDATRSSRAIARYHGATAGAMSLTGDPRRWAVEPGIPGVVHVLDPYHGIERGWESAESSLAMIEENHSARRSADDCGRSSLSR